MNSNNLCIFEGRMTQNTTFSQFQGNNGPVDNATFSISVRRVLTAQQRQEVKNGNQNIKQNDFVQFSLIGGQVGTLKQYFTAGTPIKVIAHYQTYETTDKQSGAKKYGHIFEVDQIAFVVSQSQQQTQNNQGQSNAGNNNYQQQPVQNNYNNNYQQPQQKPNNQPQQAAPQNNFEMFPQEEFPF